ncbi:MAG: hypothetical protein ACPLKP_00320 [Microgenomates group bacterium]
MFKLTKRKKFVITSGLLSFGFLLMILGEILPKEIMIGIMMVVSYFLSAWALSEGLNGIKWFTVLILPVLFTGGIGLFYFFLSSSFLTRLLVVFFYGIGVYILLLVGNIFSVAAIRTIQLLRSAQVVGFLFTLVIAFLFYSSLFSFKFPYWINFFVSFLIAFLLVIPGLWSVNLEEKISLRVLIYSLIISLIQGEIALAFSFWPTISSVTALALISSLYLNLGLGQHYLNERLFKKVIKEYLAETIFVFLIIFLTTFWSG